MLCYDFLLTSLLLISGCVLQSSCQSVVTFTSKNNQTLPCPINAGTVAVTWTEQLDPTVTVFQYIVNTPNVTKSSAAKYTNFIHTLVLGSFLNLVITDVEENDGGKYQCIVVGNPLIDPITYDVTVEVLGAVMIKYLSQEVDVLDVTVGELYDLTCYATGAGSVAFLMLIWDPPLYDKQLTMAPNGSYTDYSITSTYTAVKGVSYITCQLTGYAMQEDINTELISDTVYLNVRYVPACSLNAEKLYNDCREVRLTCECDASPQVITEYSFFNEGNLINETTVDNINIKVDYDSTSELSCIATNNVGPGNMSTTEKHACYPTETVSTMETITSNTDSDANAMTTGLIVGFVVVSVIVIITIVLVILLLVQQNVCCSKGDANNDIENIGHNKYGPRGDHDNPSYDETNNDKPGDNGAGHVENTEFPVHGVINNSTKESSNPANNDSQQMQELKYTEIDHQETTVSNEVGNIKEEPPTYSEVQQYDKRSS